MVMIRQTICCVRARGKLASVFFRRPLRPPAPRRAVVRRYAYKARNLKRMRTTRLQPLIGEPRRMLNDEERSCPMVVQLLIPRKAGSGVNPGVQWSPGSVKIAKGGGGSIWVFIPWKSAGADSFTRGEGPQHVALVCKPDQSWVGAASRQSPST